METLGVDETTLLMKWNVRVRTGFSWLKIGPNGGLL
jgi:hypothetical protein